MLETGSKQPEGTGKTVPLLIAAGLALVFLALGYLVWQYETGETEPTVVLTDEARACRLPFAIRLSSTPRTDPFLPVRDLHNPNEPAATRLTKQSPFVEFL